MIKTFAITLVCAASVVSMAQAQAPGSAGAGASVGAGSSGGSTGIIGGGSVVTPPASTGAGISGGAGGARGSVSQPSVDINQAQQPGIGVNSGASGNGSIKPPGR
jgi:hypothetical protein